MNKDLKVSIKSLYNSVPPVPKTSGMEDTIIQVRKLVKQSEDNSLCFWKFFFIQFGFIRKKVWLIQMVIILLCSIKLICFPEGMATIAMISAAAPLLVTASINELYRSYAHRTVEIELSTRYSFKQLMLTRITILGLLDIFGLTIILILSGVNMDLRLCALILYIFVPFLVTCFGCLFILNHFKNTDCTYMCVLTGLFIALIVWIAADLSPKLYQSSAISLWVIMFMIALGGVYIEVYKLLKSCSEKLDKMTV